MLYTVKEVNEVIKTIQTFKENQFINTLTLWFENNYIIEINKKNYKHILYEYG